MRRWTISRRDFLALVAAGAAACKRTAAVSTSASTSASASAAPSLPATKILPAAEARIVDAITARILPSDEAPGAREANTLVFVDNQLAAGDLAPLGNGVIVTARIVDGEAKKRHQIAFVDLDGARQDAILSDLADAKLDVKFPQREAFRLLHMLTLESLFSDPIHGGNPNMIGWKWIRFPTPTLRRPNEGGDHEHHH
jgi:gluconate 2-dehydrogenase gamma chain